MKIHDVGNHSYDFIIGKHSILEALNNPYRSWGILVCHRSVFTEYMPSSKNRSFQYEILEENQLQKFFIDEDSFFHNHFGMAKNQLDEKNLENIKKVMVVFIQDKHVFQEWAKRVFIQKEIESSRVPGQAFYIAKSLESHRGGIGHLREDLNRYSLSSDYLESRWIFCDGITDVQNIGAIIRTAQFYKVQGIIMYQKSHLKLSPHFFRNASGATEYIKIYQVKSAQKCLDLLQEFQVKIIGFSEHATCELTRGEVLKLKQNTHKDSLSKPQDGICLLLGSEEFGISPYLLKSLKHLYQLKSQGPLQSLNVSVSAAVICEKVWGY
jgi:tRNA G18 (ribose-2'-O)-methylase SpoU